MECSSIYHPSEKRDYDYNVINGIGYGCEEAVISALKQSKKWNPGTDNGRPMVTDQSVSFIFKLTE